MPTCAYRTIFAWLCCFDKSEEDLVEDRKGAVWKIVLASWIKSQCGVSNVWLSDHLHMGHPSNVSRMIVRELKDAQRNRKLWKKLKSAKK